MNTFWKKIAFAFRNVQRNRKRTFLTALSIFFAAFISLLAQGWVAGMMSMFLQNLVQYQTGDLRVTTEGYVARTKFMPVDETIADPAAVKKAILALPGVIGAEERIPFGIMLSKGENTQSALAFALEPDNKRMDIFNRLSDADGKALKDVKVPSEGILVGWKLAKKLGIREGEEILVAGRTSEGGLNGIKVKVTGLFRTGIGQFDTKSFVLRMPDAKKLLKLGDSAVAIYVFAKAGTDHDKLAESVRAVLPAGLKVQTPADQVGSYWEILSKTGQIFGIFLFIILFLASFVVINTMVMAVFERMREIGTLKALGMTDKGIYWNFTIEGGILGLIGGIPGAILAALLLVLMNRTGINLESSFGSLDMPIESVLKPVFQFSDFCFVLVMSAVVPAIASTFPARQAKRLSPAEALRKI